MPNSPRKNTHHPPDKPLQNVQDGFLNHVRKERTAVTILLTGGARLTGLIKSFDKYALILESGGQEQLLFKHAICSVSVSRARGTASPAGGA